jgi:hypothetical protein
MLESQRSRTGWKKRGGERRGETEPETGRRTGMERKGMEEILRELGQKTCETAEEGVNA